MAQRKQPVGLGEVSPKEGFKIRTFGIFQSQLNPAPQQEAKPGSNHAAPVPLHSLFLSLPFPTESAGPGSFPTPKRSLRPAPSHRGVYRACSYTSQPAHPPQDPCPAIQPRPCTLQIISVSAKPAKNREKIPTPAANSKPSPKTPPGKMRFHLSAPEIEGSAASLSLLPWQFWGAQGMGDPLSARTLFPGSPKDSRSQPSCAGAAPRPPRWGWDPQNQPLLRTQLGKTFNCSGNSVLSCSAAG